MGTKDSLIAEFKESTVFQKYVDEHPEFTICDKVIGTMICDCTKPATGNDCCCPYRFRIINLLHGIKRAYEVKESLSKTCECESCKMGGFTRAALREMSAFCAGCLPCGNVENWTKLPSEKDQPKNYKLNCYLETNSTDEGAKTVFQYDKQCQTCGIKNVILPLECLQWETPSVKYQCRQKVTLNAHYNADSGGGYADKFVKVGETSRETWDHLNENPGLAPPQVRQSDDAPGAQGAHGELRLV